MGRRKPEDALDKSTVWTFAPLCIRNTLYIDDTLYIVNDFFFKYYTLAPN